MMDIKPLSKAQRGLGATICFLAAPQPLWSRGQSWKEQQASRLPSSGPAPVLLTTSSAVLSSGDSFCQVGVQEREEGLGMMESVPTDSVSEKAGFL